MSDTRSWTVNVETVGDDFPMHRVTITDADGQTYVRDYAARTLTHLEGVFPETAAVDLFSVITEQGGIL